MRNIIILVNVVLLFSLPILGGNNTSKAANVKKEGAETLNLQLRETIEIALKNNLVIKAAESGYRAIKSTFLQKISPEAPEYYLENSGMSKFSNVISNYGERWSGIIQPFDFPLKWYYKGKASLQEIKSAEMDYNMMELDLIERVTEVYNRVLMKKRINEYEEENLALLKDFLNKAQLKYELGESPHIEVLKARVEFSKGETNKLIADNELKLAIENLKFLLNLGENRSINPIDELKYVYVDFDLHTLKGLALNKHPEIKSSEYKYLHSKTNKSLAWSSFLPDWYVGFFRVSFGDPSEGKKWASQIGINIPVWFFLKQTGEIKQANAELSAAEAQLENKRNMILLRVDRAYKELKAFEKSVLMYEEHILKESEEMYRIASVSYTEGEADYIELLEAQRTLTGTRKDYIQVLYDFQVALAALIKEIGGKLPGK